MEIVKILHRLKNKFEFEVIWLYRGITLKRVTRFCCRIVFLCLFAYSYYMIVSQFIDFPRGREQVAVLEELAPLSFDIKWEGECKSYDEVERYDGRLTDEEKQKLKDICFIEVSLKDTRYIRPALNLDSSIFQQKICIIGDASFIPEQEYDSNNKSVWDIREFGKISNDGKCFIIDQSLNEKAALPVKLFPSIERNYLIKSLVNEKQALITVYLFAFIFNVIFWKSIFDFFVLIIRSGRTVR